MHVVKQLSFNYKDNSIKKKSVLRSALRVGLLRVSAESDWMKEGCELGGCRGREGGRWASGEAGGWKEACPLHLACPCGSRDARAVLSKRVLRSKRKQVTFSLV